MAMIIVKMMVKGPRQPMMSMSFWRPSSTLSVASTAIATEPTQVGRPKYWCTVAPAPEIMVTTTQKRKKGMNHSKNMPRYLPQ